MCPYIHGDATDATDVESAIEANRIASELDVLLVRRSPFDCGELCFQVDSLPVHHLQHVDQPRRQRDESAAHMEREASVPVEVAAKIVEETGRPPLTKNAPLGFASTADLMAVEALPLATSRCGLAT